MLRMQKKNVNLKARLETPIGTKPAAKVIRSSRCNESISSTNPVASAASEYPVDSSDSEGVQDDVNRMPPNPFVGNIVERSRRRRSDKNVKRMTALPLQDLNRTTSSGFPSVKISIGTFASKNALNARLEKAGQQDAVKRSAYAQRHTNLNDINSITSLKEDAARESQSIMSQMTIDELVENAKELQETLSPELINFLKNRKNKNESNTIKVVTDTADDNVARKSDAVETSVDDVEANMEKERFARSLASIKLLKDLDVAYEAEIERLGLPVSTETRPLNPDQFEISCDLLRSTSFQQRLWAARFVSKKLKEDVVSGCRCQLDQEWPYPLSLPVSLRCMLDEPISTTNHGMLHACALQSLYLLALMRCPVEDAVDVRFDSEGHLENEWESFSRTFQHFCLDDGIPRRCTGEAHASSTPLNTDEASGKTSSSLSDGRNFCRDPIWTLFTDMKLLPRLAELLRMVAHTYSAQTLINPESIQTICGILAMMSQRSPGAASAIVMHRYLLRDLSRIALSKKAGSYMFQHTMARPFFILLQTLARQSRLAAENLQWICDDGFFSQALVEMSKNYACYRLQQEVIVLWRTFLRYGLCLSTTPTVITFASPHLTLGKSSQSILTDFSLSAEFFSCLTVVIDCVRAQRIRGTRELLVGSEDLAVLSEATSWIASAKRLSLHHVTATIQESAMNVDVLKHRSSILRFVTDTLKATSTAEDVSELVSWAFPLSEMDAWAEALMALLENVDNHFVLRSVCSGHTVVELQNEQDLSNCSLSMEASFYTFIESLTVLITTLSKRRHLRGSAEHEASCRAIQLLNAKFQEQLGVSLKSLNTSCRWNKPYTGRPRCSWINRAQYAVCEYINELGTSILKTSSRGLGLALIGRLELGDEKLATCLFGFDYLFRDGSMEASLVSPLQNMLRHELCMSADSQKQLDHSYKLHRACGISTYGDDRFRLDSLRCDCDLAVTAAARSDMLPLGRLWPWKILLGSLDLSESVRGITLLSPDANAILLSAFRMINELEDQNNAFASSLNVGGKLYYLMNACLLPESALANEQIQSACVHLFDLYFDQMNVSSIQEFVRECVQSSPKSASKASENNSDSEKIYLLLTSEVLSEGNYSDHDVRALMTFVGDLCDAFLESGTQSVFFVKCIRTFVMKGFPSRIRCEVLTRLRDVVHLLSLEEDGDCYYPLTKLLSGGHPSAHWSTRDSTAILNTLSSLFAATNIVRFSAKLIMTLSVASLARNITISISTNGDGLVVSKRRVMNLHISIARAVMKTASIFCSNEKSLAMLVKISCDVCGALPVDSCSTEATFGDTEWSEFISAARAALMPATDI